MHPIDPRLEEIRVLEDAVAIKTTKNYAGLGKFTFDKDSIQFRPGIFPLIFALAFGCAIFILPISAAFSHGGPVGSQFGGIFASTMLGLFVLFLSIRQFKVQKNFLVRIDKSGITLDDQFYSWADIYETAILEKQRSIRLVIVLKENSAYQLYDLRNLRSSGIFFPINMSKYIEHFKQASLSPNLPL